MTSKTARPCSLTSVMQYNISASSFSHMFPVIAIVLYPMHI